MVAVTFFHQNVGLSPYASRFADLVVDQKNCLHIQLNLLMHWWYSPHKSYHAKYAVDTPSCTEAPMQGSLHIRYIGRLRQKK